MKVLITGGSGFLGRVTARLMRKVGYDVTILCRGDYSFLADEGFTVIRGDICDRTFLLNAFNGFDEVHHIASLTGISTVKFPFYRINVDGTRNVIDACLKNRVKKLIYTSSPSVVYDGTSEEMADESAPYPEMFLNPYSETKAEAEKMVLDENTKGSLLTVSLRPHLIWGPEDTNLIPRLLEKAAKGRLFMVGDGNNYADLTYVENAALAQLKASESLTEGSRVCGKAYFITNDEPVLLWEFINRILEGVRLGRVERRMSFKSAYMLGAAIERVYSLLKITREPVMTRFLASQLATTHTYSVSKAKDELGYIPKVSMDEGLDKLFSYLKRSD
jgi:nucleoside-diphosphate-sugar epimerase